MKQADLVAVGVFEVGLPPEPGTVGWVFIENEPFSFELLDGAAEIVAFEIENDVIRDTRVLVLLYGQSGIPVGAFEASVPRKGIDNKRSSGRKNDYQFSERLYRKGSIAHVR